VQALKNMGQLAAYGIRQNPMTATIGAGALGTVGGGLVFGGGGGTRSGGVIDPYAAYR
jgi:hypothetical protein